MSITQYSPDNWLLTLHRALVDYISDEINKYVKSNLNVNSGLLLYEIVMDWPEADDLAKYMTLEKSIIHLVIDDIESTKLGFGTDVVNGAETLQVAPLPDFVKWQQARSHVVNYDVGIWASDKTGGSTARLAIRQMLDFILGGDYARRKLSAATNGIQIVRFSGGTFATEQINDIRIYRVLDLELVVRVYSRAMLADQVITEDIVQAPNLAIDNTSIS